MGSRTVHHCIQALHTSQHLKCNVQRRSSVAAKHARHPLNSLPTLFLEKRRHLKPSVLALSFPFSADKIEESAVEVEPVPFTERDANLLLDKLVETTRRTGCDGGLNVVAFSGGVDSSLAAFLVLQAFGASHSAACIGVSSSLAQSQLSTARSVAADLGITLWEVPTTEGEVPQYIENTGESCFHCKTALYTTLNAVASKALDGGAKQCTEVVLFNGTNADDLRDPTRLGLLAAANMHIQSPLARVPKAGVRAVARAAGLPNWNLAAQKLDKKPVKLRRLQLCSFAFGTPGETVYLPAPSLEVQLLLQHMKHQQEAHDAAMKIQQAERKQHDVQSQLLTKQINAPRADAAKARSDKEEVTTAT
ncbi:hypothetical protein CYMTET_54128 [Cymbomonas tetramitiformis]|uniref:NAD/GMP synthase domain-containing protein n=1 Tax=Cymbomonas tetramitiformis TaxID=36881 RepID=A0AAE0BH08_9CHLO|nr:hypothetical protein CYMTET_54128 [Cymbomonas tetramitiformis]